MTAARFWWKRYEEEGNVNSKPHHGRPEVLTQLQKDDIVNRVTENPFSTAISFAREYGVNDKTVSSVLKTNGLHCHTAATQTRLTEEHRINRIAFCRMLLEEWDENKLRSIIFSDEKTFCTDVSWRSKVYRPSNTRYDPRYVKETGRSSRITNHYWGTIGFEGPSSDLIRIEGKFNSTKYMQIIRAHVVPMMLRFDRPRIFMQDNSPVHTCSKTMALLARQNFELMDWPPLSPDLNPIENVWSYMIYNWPTIYPRRPDILDAVVQERWNGLRGNHGIIYELSISKNIYSH